VWPPQAVESKAADAKQKSNGTPVENLIKASIVGIKTGMLGASSGSSVT
jgi:hypothetical protein